MVALAVPIPKLLQVNYTESSDERHPQIYVHTSTDIFRLISDIKEISKKTGAGNQLLIQVVSPQYWPLPFYLKDFPQAKFWGKADVDTSLEAPLVLAASSQRTEVRNILTGSYSIRNYTLRPGYYLDLWMNNRVLEAYETPLLVPDLLKAVHPSSSLAPGLREEIFNNGFLQGKPVIVNGARKEVHFYFDSDDKKPLKPPYSIRWTGYIKIPVDGVYRFSLDSDDGSKLIIDKQALIDNSGGHPLTRKSRGANLSKGFHALELTYSELGGTAELEFYWKPPQSIELLVPSTALFTDYARQ
jgi:hypothetical protein